MPLFEANEIRLGGMPLKLHKLNRTVKNIYNTNDLFNKTVYAMEIIPISGIALFSQDPSNSQEEYSFVWNGTRLATVLATDGKYYFYTNIDSNPSIESIPYKEVILSGVPLAADIDNNLIMYNSGYKEKDIERYSAMTIGGVPLAVGQIENYWYWLIYSD